MPLNVNPNSLILTLQNSRACLMKYCKIRQSHWWNTWIVMLCRNGELTHSCFNKERTQLLCLIGFIADEKQGKWELLNHYRAITNIADQNALQEQPHNNHKVHFLEKQTNSAMKNCSALSNVEHEQPKQILVISLTFVICLLLQMKTVEKHHGKS